MAKKTPEGKLKEEVKAYLESIGAFYFMPPASIYGKPTVDFVVCHEGYFIAIETKVKPRQVTKLQQMFLDAVRLAGGVTVVAYSIEDVKSAVWLDAR
jgi:hypothetical protein